MKKMGAAPREEGAKMFIGDDGRFFGTVGGGCVEAEVWQEAKNVAKTQNGKASSTTGWTAARRRRGHDLRGKRRYLPRTHP